MRLVAFSALAIACSEPDPKGACENVRCSDHGVCREDGPTARCECDEGWVDRFLACVPEADTDGGACPDADGDRHRDLACGGDDCDDADADIHPGVLDSSQWLAETVDRSGGAGRAPAIAIDSTGVVHVAFHDSIADTLEVARGGGGAWTVETVGAAGLSPAIAIGPNDALHVVYEGPSEIRHAAFVTDAWSVEVVASGSVSNPSVAVADDGTVHVAYEDEGHVHHASDETGDWIAVPLDFAVTTAEPSIALGPDSAPRIAFGTRVDDEWTGLSVAHLEGEIWTIDEVDPSPGAGAGPTLVVGPGGADYVTYGLAEEADLVFATNDGGSWALGVIQDDFVVHAPAGLAIDASGDLHVAYLVGDAPPWNLRYGMAGASGWDPTTIDVGAIGLEPTIAVGRGGIQIAYGAEDVGDVRIQRRALANGVDDDCDGAEL